MNIKDIDKISTSPRKGKKGFLKSLMNLVGGGGGGSSSKLVLTPRYVSKQGQTVTYCVDVPFDDITASDNIEIINSNGALGSSNFIAKVIVTYTRDNCFVCGFFVADTLDRSDLYFYKGPDNLAYFNISGGK